MTNYRRFRVPGGIYFFTLRLEDHAGTLLTDHIDPLRAAFRAVRTRHPFEIDAIVILPSHLHCLWSLPENDSDYSLRWRQIKSNFSRAIPADETISPSRRRKNERGIWQRRFWEHTIRDDRGYATRFDYIHYNPVKHGFVSRVKDWPYSSFHRCVRLGVYSEDWGGGSGLKDLDLEEM
jgi:putative transposase